MSSSEGPPEYELATSPLQMLAGVVITLSAHLEASAQLLREESKLTADCRSTPRSLRFYAFSNSRKSATALPSLEEILEVVLDIAIESDTMEAEAQSLALIFLNRALLSSAVRANTALLLLPGNWELLWLSCVILSAKSYYDAAVFNDDFESCLRGEMTISQMREAEASLLHDALGWGLWVDRDEVIAFDESIRGLVASDVAAGAEFVPTGGITADGLEQIRAAAASPTFEARVREIVAAKQAVLEAQLRRRAARQEAELAKQLAGEGSARLIAPLAAMKGPSREGSYRGSPLGDRAEAGRAQERARRCSLDDDVLAAGVATSGGLVPGAGACGGSPLSAMSAGPTETKLWRLSDVEGGGGGGAGAGKGLPRVNTTGGGGESSSSPAGARGDMDAFKSREGSFLSTDGSRSPRGDGSHGGSHTKPRSHRSASFQETRIEPLGDKGHDRVKRLSADELGSLPSGSPAYSSGGGSSFGRERRYGSPAPGGSAPRRRNSIDDGDDDFDGGGQRSHGGSFMSERGSSFGGGFRRHSQESFQQGRIAGRVSGAGAGGVNFFGLFRKKKQSNSPRKLAPIAGSARQSRATTNDDDDDRDGADAGPDGIGPD